MLALLVHGSARSCEGGAAAIVVDECAAREGNDWRILVERLLAVNLLHQWAHVQAGEALSCALQDDL